MTPVYQTKFGDPDGNCFEACIATITGIALDEIPHYLDDDWFGSYSAWLREHGWLAAWWEAGTGCEPPGLAIANGVASRGLRHSVVVRDGALAHDPHPEGTGLLVDQWLALWREATE